MEHVENLDLGLAMSKALGGAGGKTNPEELFAAGYGGTFMHVNPIKKEY